MSRNSLAIALAACMLAAPAAQEPPQQSPPTFASGTQIVQVDVRIFDKDGHFVTDLKPEDFTIKEDGVAQKVVSLTLVGAAGAAPLAPLAPLAPAPLAPSAPLAPLAPAPAVWLFVFDTIHLTPGGLHNTQKAVVDFLRDKFRDGDIGGVIANGKMANNRLTSDRAELVKAADDVRMPGNTRNILAQLREFPPIEDESEAWEINSTRSDTNPALVRAVQRACNADTQACKEPIGDELVKRDLLAKSADVTRTVRETANLTLSVVTGLSNGLARMVGPKTVVFLSEGFILRDMERELEQAVGMANRAGVHLYTIDARGLNKGTASSNSLSQAFAFDSFGPSNHDDMQADGINALAVDTGGVAIHSENNFGRALDLIQQDAGTYYVIGYTPANQNFDGKYRKIDASVDRPGVKVRSRRGYLALEPAKLLKPTPITTAPPAAREGHGAAGENTVFAAPALGVTAGAGDDIGEVVAPEAIASPLTPAAKALRSSIESHGLVQELQGAERLAPSKANDLAGKGWAAYQKGDLEHAAVYLGQAAQAPDAHPWVRYALGLAQLGLARYPDAVASWEHVRRAAPEFEPVYFNLADGYMLQKDNAAALNVLRDAQARWPNDSEVWNASGVLEIRRGVVDSAIRSFTRATAADATDSLGFFNLARAYQMRAAQSQRFDSTLQKWVGGETDTKKAVENYTKYIDMGGPYVQQAKQALQALAWKSNP